MTSTFLNTDLCGVDSLINASGTSTFTVTSTIRGTGSDASIIDEHETFHTSAPAGQIEMVVFDKLRGC